MEVFAAALRILRATTQHASAAKAKAQRRAAPFSPLDPNTANLRDYLRFAPGPGCLGIFPVLITPFRRRHQYAKCAGDRDGLPTQEDCLFVEMMTI